MGHGLGPTQYSIALGPFPVRFLVARCGVRFAKAAIFILIKKPSDETIHETNGKRRTW